MSDYCYLFGKLIKKYDLINLIKYEYIDTLCGELKIINKLLNTCSNIIFNKNLSQKEAIKQISKIRDNEGHKVFGKNDAESVYDKFIQIHQKGGANKLSEENQKLQNKKDQLNQELGNIKSEKKEYNSEKLKLDIMRRNLNKDINKYNSSNDKYQSKKSQFDAEKQQQLQQYNSEIRESKENYKQALKNIEREEKLAEENKSVFENLNKKKKKLSNKISKKELTEDKKLLLKNSFDMMEVLLICLSLIPIAGWAFDFPLFIYALVKKKYNLAIITILNWYIWGFWLLFGLYINMGPTMKVSYLGNKQNFIKKILLYSFDNPKKNKDPYTDVREITIKGKKYLKDSDGNLYDNIIRNPELVGVYDRDTDKIVKTSDPNYNEIVEKNKVET